MARSEKNRSTNQKNKDVNQKHASKFAFTAPSVNYDAELSIRVSELEALALQLRNAINQAPNGTLQVSSSHGKTIFLHNIPQKNRKGKKKYIRKDQIDIAKELAQKDYNIKLLEKVEEEMEAIKNCKGVFCSSLDDIFDNLSDVRKSLVDPFYESVDEYAKRWSLEAYESNPGFPEGLSYTTLRGEKVRSKSEKNIADSLARYDIPYKYEKKLVLNTMGVVYPDFTILDKRSRK